MANQLGFIGLGRMGKNIVLHALKQGIDVVVYNRTREVTDEFIKEAHPGNLTPAYDISEFVKHLNAPRVIWIMVPAGKPVDEMIKNLLSSGLTAGDTIIDGGNSLYTDSVRRAADLAKQGIMFIDSGTSGGIEGARSGACLMLGGEAAHVRQMAWLWNALVQAPTGSNLTSGGWEYVGPSGAGHFTKMVHNGIEYGQMQALAEGFDVLSRGPYQLNLPAIAAVWNRGSIVRGWLMELTARVLKRDAALSEFTGKVGGGESGTWVVEAAKSEKVDVPVLLAAIEARKKSNHHQSFAGKIVSALRHEFGGHTE